MASIRAKNLVKDYGAFHAVKGIDFEIADGEFISILGPSGCGKSSTMRMIAGLESISGGTIEFNGKVVNDISPSDRNVAMAFESYALYPTISVFDNIAFPLRARSGLDEAQIKAKVHQIAERMELIPLLAKKPGDLSSGQAQRTSLARALVRSPEVFLLDEPISHLDTAQRYRMRQLIQAIHREFRTTFIYVTHDQEEAMTLADRIIVMSHGEIQQIGTPSEVYNQPRNLFVAQFVGEPPINLLPAVKADGGVTVAGQRLTLGGQAAVRLRNLPDGPVQMAVRPEHIAFASQPGGGHLQARHVVTEDIQDYKIVNVRLGESMLAIVSYQAPPVADDGTIGLRLNEEHVFFFASETK